MKRVSSTLLTLALLAAPIAGLAENEYCTISELREQAQAGWTQTYETKWRNVSVDIAIVVPDVQTCPILRISQAPFPDASLLEAYDNTAPSAPDIGYLWAQKGEELSISGRTTNDAQAIIPGDTAARAEDNPLSWEEALQIIDDDLHRVTGTRIASDWRIRWANAHSREYHVRKQSDGTTRREAATETGFYDFEADQLLSGIPMRWGTQYTHYHSNVMPVGGTLIASVTDAERFGISLKRAQVESTVLEDVPLLSLNAVRAGLEKLIEAGRVREIDGMELCYMSFFDPENKALNYAVPVWCVHAAYARDAKREYVGVHVDKDGDTVDDREWVELYFLAQTGAFLDPDDGAKDRCEFKGFLSWEDVK